MQRKTQRKIRYRHLTAKQKSEICNGCGGKGGWVKPPHRKFFEEECNQHDFNYFLGFTEEHRKKADLQLRDAMISKVKTLGFWNRQRLGPWCHIYYMAIRMAGKKFFYYGTEEQEVPNI